MIQVINLGCDKFPKWAAKLATENDFTLPQPERSGLTSGFNVVIDGLSKVTFQWLDCQTGLNVRITIEPLAESEPIIIESVPERPMIGLVPGP